MPGEEEEKSGVQTPIEFTKFAIIPGTDYNRQKRNGQVDIISLYDLIGITVQEYMKEVDMPKQYQATFMEEYPKTDKGKFDTRYNVITASIHERLRGNTARAGEAPRRPLKATFRRCDNDDSNPGHAIITESKWMDNMIKFRIISKDKHVADMMALWFENMMEIERHVILLAGVQQYFFDSRGPDMVEEILGQELHVRELFYFVRTEESYYYHTKTIQTVFMEVGLAPQHGSLFIDGREFKIYGDTKE